MKSKNTEFLIQKSYKKPGFKLLSIVWFLFMSVIMNGQNLQPVKQLHANQLGQEKGLLQLNVKGMALDDLGYLWVGTEDGLHRFNGYEFNAYLHNPNNDNSIKDDHIRSLFFTSDTLWIATNSFGIAGFIPSKNTFFYPYEDNENPDLKTSYKIISFNKRFILFSVKNNLIVFNRRTKLSRIIRLPETPMESYVTDILHVTDDLCLLATTATGVLELNWNTFEINKTSILKNRNIECFLELDSTIYAGTKTGLIQYNLHSKSSNEIPLNFSVRCFYQLNEKQFYIGTDNGLFLYNTSDATITPITLKTGENKFYKEFDINEIKGDKKGNLWIGTEGEGLIFYNFFQKKFNTLKPELKEYPAISNISSFQFLKGEDSTLWIGSKQGMIKYSFISKQFKLYNASDQFLIYAICKDKNNTIWAGGFTTGLLKYDSVSDDFKKIESAHSSLPDNDIVEIISIDSNTLWICTWAGGIHKFDVNQERFEELLFNGKRLNRARTSLKDSKGNIWLGTDQGALKIKPSGEIISYNSDENSKSKLSGERIFNIAEDLDGNIWFGTNVGLTKLDSKSDSTVLYYKQKGLPNDFIYSVIIAGNNDVWVSTNYGISVLDTKNETFKNYTASDGLQNNEFNGKAGYKDKYGVFYFGGISGINIFTPDVILEYPHLPDIYIESVDLFNTPIQRNELFKDTLQFKSNENVLTINYSALNYINAEKCSYSYKMEGFDADWRQATKDRNTTYTNLNPGEYTFWVKATNDAGVWNEKPDKMTIIIIPPWYKTALSKFIFITLFLLSGVLFYLYKINALKRDKQKLEQLVSERTKDVVDKNKALKQASVEAELQRDNIRFLMKELTHRVKNNLQIISSLLNIQANSLENKPAVEALKMAKNRILAIAQIENKISNENDSVQIDVFIKELTAGVLDILSDEENLKFKVNYDLPEIKIKNLNTTVLGLILNELITNTSKYAFDEFKPENELKIICTISQNDLHLAVRDNGKGFNSKQEKPSKSMGLELVSEMVNQLNGTISTNSINGTENCINIPI